MVEDRLRAHNTDDWILQIYIYKIEVNPIITSNDLLSFFCVQSYSTLRFRHVRVAFPQYRSLLLVRVGCGLNDTFLLSSTRLICPFLDCPPHRHTEACCCQNVKH
jgi:hypothetical protein